MGCEYLLQFYVRSSFLHTSHRSKMVIDPPKKKKIRKKNLQRWSVGLCVLRNKETKPELPFSIEQVGQVSNLTHQKGSSKKKSKKLRTFL